MKKSTRVTYDSSNCNLTYFIGFLRDTTQEIMVLTGVAPNLDYDGDSDYYDKVLKIDTKNYDGVWVRRNIKVESKCVVARGIIEKSLYHVRPNLTLEFDVILKVVDNNYDALTEYQRWISSRGTAA